MKVTLRFLLLAFGTLFPQNGACADIPVRSYTRNAGPYSHANFRSPPNDTRPDNWRNAGDSGYIILGPAASAPVPSASAPVASLAPAPQRAQKEKPATDATPKARPISEGNRVFNERKAILEYQLESAIKGNPQAQYVMGLRYLAGIDVPKNEETARDFLNAARRSGELRARDKILELDRTRQKAEAEAREAIEALPPQEAKPASSARFHPDGQPVTTLSADGTARVWDAQTGKPLSVPGATARAEFSPDNAGIVTVSPDGTARLWDVKTAKPLPAP